MATTNPNGGRPTKGRDGEVKFATTTARKAALKERARLLGMTVPDLLNELVDAELQREVPPQQVSPKRTRARRSPQHVNQEVLLEAAS